MPCHIIHIAVPAAAEPREQTRLAFAQFAIGDSDLLKPKLGAPLPDVSSKRGEVIASAQLCCSALHTPILNQPSRIFPLAAEANTLALGHALGRVLVPGLVIYVSGELGAGKTTLARGVLRGLGFAGRVKSPTFTLVEVYNFSKLNFYHFDFYRFEDSRELRESGFSEYFAADAVCLVEWPERAEGLASADIRITIRLAGAGRTAEVVAETEAGELCLNRLQYSV